MEKAKISGIDFADFQCTTDDRIGQELSVRVKLSKNVPFGLPRMKDNEQTLFVSISATRKDNTVAVEGKARVRFSVSKKIPDKEFLREFGADAISIVLNRMNNALVALEQNPLPFDTAQIRLS